MRLLTELCEIATASSDGVVRLWDFEMVRLQQEIVVNEEVTCLTFIQNYPLLVVGDSTGWVHIWALNTQANAGKCCRG
jgi:WD40 repeat protein